MKEARNQTDPQSATPGVAILQRVILIEEAEPRKVFKVKRTAFRGPPDGWDPDDAESEDADLWTVTDEVITKVRYGLPYGSNLPVDTIGWIAWYEGRPFLVLAECV